MDDIIFTLFSVLLFFGGNAEQEKTLKYRAQLFSEYGYTTIAVEPPGFGKSAGKPGDFIFLLFRFSYLMISSFKMLILSILWRNMRGGMRNN